MSFRCFSGEISKMRVLLFLSQIFLVNAKNKVRWPEEREFSWGRENPELSSLMSQSKPLSGTYHNKKYVWWFIDEKKFLRIGRNKINLPPTAKWSEWTCSYSNSLRSSYRFEWSSREWQRCSWPFLVRRLFQHWVCLQHKLKIYCPSCWTEF